MKKRDMDERRWCDRCKNDVPTEGFIGRLGNKLWFCLECVQEMKLERLAS
jgi:hypothetical protein